MELLSFSIQVDRRVHDTRVRGGQEVEGLCLCECVCVRSYLLQFMEKSAKKNIKTVLCANEITKAGFVCACVCVSGRERLWHTHIQTHTLAHTLTPSSAGYATSAQHMKLQ